MAQYLLLTQGLKVNHLRLVMGTSMGCMHSWVWPETYTDLMDAAMPLACLPVQIAGRNRVWRKLAMDSITSDPGCRCCCPNYCPAPAHGTLFQYPLGKIIRLTDPSTKAPN